MRLGYYQIFWAYGFNTFEYRYDVEVKALLKQGTIKRFSLVHQVNK